MDETASMGPCQDVKAIRINPETQISFLLRHLLGSTFSIGYNIFISFRDPNKAVLPPLDKPKLATSPCFLSFWLCLAQKELHKT